MVFGNAKSGNKGGLTKRAPENILSRINLIHHLFQVRFHGFTKVGKKVR